MDRYKIVLVAARMAASPGVSCKHPADSLFEHREQGEKVFVCTRCGQVSHSWDEFGSADKVYRGFTRRSLEHELHLLSRKRPGHIVRYEETLEALDEDHGGTRTSIL